MVDTGTGTLYIIGSFKRQTVDPDFKVIEIVQLVNLHVETPGICPEYYGDQLTRVGGWTCSMGIKDRWNLRVWSTQLVWLITKLSGIPMNLGKM